MSKNLIIAEGRRGRRFGGVKKLETKLQGGGSCFWVPEDEVQLETLFASENGVYKPEKYGYDEASVHVIDGTLTDLFSMDNLAYLPDADGFGKVTVNVPEGNYGKYSEILQIQTAKPDPNYEYHFSITGYGVDYYAPNGYNGEDTTTVKYQIMIDSHIPFYIRKYAFPVWSKDQNNARHDTTFTIYAIKPYTKRTGGLAVGTKNYRLRVISSGRYRSTWPNDSYGNRRDSTITFDDEIICPCDSNVKSKWTNNDGSILHMADLYNEQTEEYEQDPHCIVSDHESYLTVTWRDNSYYDQLVSAAPFEAKSKNTAYYFSVDYIVGEIVYGEAPRVEGAFGNVDYYYNMPHYYSSAGINFGNNPIFTGTYNEYRTYIEQNFR